MPTIIIPRTSTLAITVSADGTRKVWLKLPISHGEIDTNCPYKPYEIRHPQYQFGCATLLDMCSAESFKYTDDDTIVSNIVHHTVAALTALANRSWLLDRATLCAWLAGRDIARIFEKPITMWTAIAKLNNIINDANTPNNKRAVCESLRYGLMHENHVPGLDEPEQKMLDLAIQAGMALLKHRDENAIIRSESLSWDFGYAYAEAYIVPDYRVDENMYASEVLNDAILDAIDKAIRDGLNLKETASAIELAAADTFIHFTM
jgi:hypothetical protein